jgi:hypothetical protein
MTLATRRFLASFDALSLAEQQEAASELLRRVVRSEPEALPEDALLAAADDLFLQLDQREALDAQP